MVSYQIAYKLWAQDKNLSFYIATDVDIIGCLSAFIKIYPNAIVYHVLRCGKP